MKKSICFVITQGELGGAQRYVFDLAAALRDSYEIMVLMGAEKLELKERLDQAGIKNQVLKHLKRNIRPLADMLAVFELKKALGELRPDIVHFSSSKAGILGSIAGRLAGIGNVIFTAHGFAFLEPHSRLIRKLYFWAEKFSSRFRKKIITVSDYDRKAAIRMKLAPAEKFVTIHNGIDPSTSPSTVLGVRSGNKQVLLPELVEGSILIGTIANLYPTKGLKYLIEAAYLLTTDYGLLTTFIVIGEGQERRSLESRIRNYGLEEQFFLVGALPNAAQYLTNFDIFVLPSLKEGFPYTILEAAQAALPIVATAVGGVPEIISPHLSSPTSGEEMKEEVCGILMSPKDPRALAEAIKFLIVNSEVARQMGQNAQIAVKKFTIEKMVKETENVYQSIIG